MNKSSGNFVVVMIFIGNIYIYIYIYILKGTAKFPFPSIISKHRLSLFVTNQDIRNTQFPYNLPQGQA